MKKHVIAFIPVGLLVISVLASAGMGMMRGPGMMRGGMMNMSMTRHHYVMRNGLPSRYAGQSSPLAANAENLDAGRKLFAANCASCHGVSGQGDGPAGKALNPRPANIARFARMPMASDAYLYWTISEGGVPVGSAMPPFKDALREEEIWKIIEFLRKM